MIAFAVLHVFSFSMFWGPTPWVYLGESFPLRVRAKSIALGRYENFYVPCFPRLTSLFCLCSINQCDQLAMEFPSQARRLVVYRNH